MSIPIELGHLAMPINFFAYGKTRWHKRVSNPEALDPESYALPLRHNGWAFRYCNSTQTQLDIRTT